jgi:hypothetical protein|tara:strand:- start:2432 stop:2683 length:252 start_codon:yes stop_codon:yes gene_type:complete
MSFENRKYVVFNTSETGSIDFSQVLETSAETLRLNVSGSRTFVKYETDMPSSVSALTTKTSEYTHTEIRNLLTGSEWHHSVEE